MGLASAIESMNDVTQQTGQAPSLLHRCGAMFYDFLLVFGVLFFFSTIAVFINKGQTIEAGNIGFTVYLITIAFLFFGFFWTRSGQTLGLRTWRLRVQQIDGSNITWTQALARFCGAILSFSAFGLGYLWILFNRKRLAWHDMLSSTRVVIVPRK